MLPEVNVLEITSEELSEFCEVWEGLFFDAIHYISSSCSWEAAATAAIIRFN